MAVERYNAAEAEARWQKVCDERGIFATKNGDPRPKYYVLEMFPCPSGRIHMETCNERRLFGSDTGLFLLEGKSANKKGHSAEYPLRLGSRGFVRPQRQLPI